MTTTRQCTFCDDAKTIVRKPGLSVPGKPGKPNPHLWNYATVGSTAAKRGGTVVACPVCVTKEMKW